METAKEKVATEKAQPAVENCENKSIVSSRRMRPCEMRSYKMLALLIIFGLVLSAVWNGLMALVVIVLRTCSHLNNREGGTWPSREKGEPGR